MSKMDQQPSAYRGSARPTPFASVIFEALERMSYCY